MLIEEHRSRSTCGRLSAAKPSTGEGRSGRYNQSHEKAHPSCDSAATCLTVGFLAFSQSNNDPLDALKVGADTQKLVFENRLVRVIDNQVQVGAVEPMHSHPHGVIVYLAHSKNEVVTQDGKNRVSENNANTTVWTEATVHSVKNIGNAPTHTIRIDVKY